MKRNQPVEMLTAQRQGAKCRNMKRGLFCAAVVIPLAGCVTVQAPEKPIEINLNINIKQEVVYRLDGEAKNLIKQEPGIF